MAKRRNYRFDPGNKPVNAIALRDTVDQFYDDEIEDQLILKGDFLADMPHDKFYGWQKAGLVREATADEAKAAKAAAKEPAKEPAKAA
jgi:hypothetical protein